ncbi:hypothetical protein AAON49_09885 [Pseudotenacibaculum sp. MALMAid0570]|uniref:hypothetical protein n=1 Tax=Pseudotenacibaculum sp. MALMAid0570 TaxID=3143938 RepID=UPI0032DE3502
MNTKKETLMKKPTPLRILFILNLLLVIICFVFYGFAQSKGNVAGVPASSILYTAIAYTLLFIGLITSIKSFSLLGVRIVVLLVFAVSTPTLAFIGMVISIISFILTFNRKVQAYLNQ